MSQQEEKEKEEEEEFHCKVYMYTYIRICNYSLKNLYINHSKIAPFSVSFTLHVHYSFI